MLNKEDKRVAYRQIDELRKNPPRVTAEHRDGARKLLEKHKTNEAEKDRDIRREIKDFSKDLSGFVYNHINGVGVLFHGIGEGKRVKCSLCEQHETTMHYEKDGKWYCEKHRWFGNLTMEQQEIERSSYAY